MTDYIPSWGEHNLHQRIKARQKAMTKPINPDKLDNSNSDTQKLDKLPNTDTLDEQIDKILLYFIQETETQRKHEPITLETFINESTAKQQLKSLFIENDKDNWTIEKHIRKYMPEAFKDDKWHSISFNFKWNSKSEIELEGMKEELL